MPLNYADDGRAGLPFGNMRWITDLQERWNPVMQLQEKLDRIVRPNRLLELAGRQLWADSSFWEASRKAAAVARPSSLASSVAAGAAVARFEALALKMPPNIGRQVVGLNSLQTTFFKDWSALVKVTKPAWLPQVVALQTRFEHTLADFAEAAEADQEPAVLQDLVSTSASVLSVGAGVATAQAVTADQLSELSTALQQLVALQERQYAALEKQAARQDETNSLLAQVREQVTESRGKKMLNLLNTLLTIVGLLISVLAYLESRKPSTSPPIPAPVKPAAKHVSLQAVQALLLPQLLELLRQASPSRTVAHRAALYSYPRRHGAVAGRLSPGTTVRLLYTQRQWALVSSVADEEVISQGWVRKKYLTKARA